VQEDGDQAVVQVQYPLAGETVSFQAQMRRVDGRWYMQQNLEDAQKALAAAANARQQRQLEDNAPAPAAAQDAQMASAP
jgi:hypothetical protein